MQVAITLWIVLPLTMFCLYHVMMWCIDEWER